MSRCDETKPSCLRCKAAGRECGGYPIIKTLTFEICSDQDERRSFSYYRDRTLQHLNSFSEYRFWDRLVVQASYSHEAVRRMVVSIGALNEAVDQTDPDESRRLHTMALEQYSRALEQTVSRLDKIPPEQLLIAALMFCFFENVRGYPMAALRHLYSAISALLKNEQRLPIIEDELRPILAATHIRASSLYPQILQRPAESQDDLPAAFTSMQEAHLHFLKTVRRISTGLDQHYRSSPWETPAAISGSMYIAQLNEWREKFVNFTYSGESTCDCPAPEAVIHKELAMMFLQVQYLHALIRLQVGMSASEMTFDDRSEDIDRIMDTYDTMQQLSQIAGFDATKATECLKFSTNMIPTLTMLGLRCRDPTQRRRIITALRSLAANESQIGTRLVADILDKVMELEEETSAAETVQNAAEIPAGDRIIIASITLFRYDANADEYALLSTYGTPDLVRVRYLRPDDLQEAQKDAETTDYESFWLDYRDPAVSERATQLPEDIQLLFPQLLRTETNLFSQHSPIEDLLMTRRASLSQIFVPPVSPARSSSREQSQRAIVISSVALGLVGAGELASSR